MGGLALKKEWVGPGARGKFRRTRWQITWRHQQYKEVNYGSCRKRASEAIAISQFAQFGLIFGNFVNVAGLNQKMQQPHAQRTAEGHIRLGRIMRAYAKNQSLVTFLS